MVEHADSWYAASLPVALDRIRPPLRGDIACDVCIVGGGFAGVSAAYHLAQGGQRVVLVEAKRIGWGASGRNGGQIHPGFRQSLRWFAKTMGDETAIQVRDTSRAALAHLDGLIQEHNLPCERAHGLLTACRKSKDLDAELEEDAFAAKHFECPTREALTEDETQQALGTGGHKGALRDRDGGHLHPLVFVTGLADIAEKAGARLFDSTPVASIDSNDLRVEVETPNGTVRAQHVVLAGNGYMRDLDGEADARVLPITNFVIATKPIGAGSDDGPLPFRDAVADTRFVVRYWRPTPDQRLLFGGGEKFSTTFPEDIESFVRPFLADVYPNLAEVQIDHAWGGTLAITPHRLPLIRQLSPRVTVAVGFSGQGVVNAPFAGKIVADALLHDARLLSLFSRFPAPTFPGGTKLRASLLMLAMSYYALRDRLG